MGTVSVLYWLLLYFAARTPQARCLTCTAARTTPATRTRTRTGRTRTRTRTAIRTRTRTATATATRTPGITGRRDAAAFVAAPRKAHRVQQMAGIISPAEQDGATA